MKEKDIYSNEHSPLDIIDEVIALKRVSSIESAQITTEEALEILKLNRLDKIYNTLSNLSIVASKEYMRRTLKAKNHIDN